MRKLLLLFGVLLLCSSWVFSQQINNSGLEIWDSSGSHHYPHGFFTGLISTVSADTNVVKTTDAHSGQYAALLQYSHDDTSGRYQWGQLYYGSGDFINLKGHPFTARPDKMTFWYKYILGVTDTVVGYVFLLKWNGTMSQMIGMGEFKHFTHIPVYTKAVVPIQYFTADQPDSILMLFSCGKIWDTIPQATRFYLDDIQLEYPSAIQNNALSSRFRVYPNPLSDRVTVESMSRDKYEIRLFNMAGTMLVDTEGSNVTHTTTAFLPKGIYFLNVRDKQHSETISLLKN